MAIAVIFIIIIVNCFFYLTFSTSNAAIILAAHDEKKICRFYGKKGPERRNAAIILAAHDEKKSVDFTVKKALSGKALSGIRIPVHLLAYISRIFADIMVWFDEPMLKIPS